MEYPLWFDGVMLFILFFTLFIATTQPQIPRTPKGITFIIAIIAIFLFGLAPAIDAVGADRENYEYMFSHSNQYVRFGFRDIGFSYYTKLCMLLTNSVTLSFIISALIYVFGTIYFYIKAVPEKHLYLVLLTFLSLGFASHHYNVLRSGLCIALILIAISKGQRRWISAICMFIASSIHISGLLIIISYIVTSKIKKTKLLYFFWGALFVALIGGLFDSLDQYSHLISTVEDGRIESYLLDERDYNTNIRFDFIIYSFIPMIIGGYYIFKKRFNDDYYLHIYNTYILCNAVWLIFSRIPFNDRLAYLSWVFIPFILLYPLLCKKPTHIRHTKFMLLFLTGMIVSVNILVKYILD